MSCNKNPLLEKIQEGKDLVSTGIENAQSLFDSAQASIDQVSAAAQSAVEGIANGVKSAIGGVLSGLQDSITGMLPKVKDSLRSDLASITGKSEEEIAALREKWKDVPGIDELINNSLDGSLDICIDVPNVKLDEGKLVTEPVPPIPPSVNTENAVNHEPSITDTTESVVSRTDTDSSKSNQEFLNELTELNNKLLEPVIAIRAEVRAVGDKYLELYRSDRMKKLIDLAKRNNTVIDALRNSTLISDSDSSLIDEFILTKVKLETLKLKGQRMISFTQNYARTIALDKKFTGEIVSDEIKTIIDSNKELIKMKYRYEQW